MDKFLISLGLALLVGAAVVFGVYLHSGAEPGKADEKTLMEVAALRQELSRTREALGQLVERIARLETRDGGEPQTPETAGSPETESSATETTAPARPNVAVDESFRETVFALIEEERRLRDEERLRRAEELRTEIEELRQGPYDTFNMKVNSMAKALGLDDGQRDRYFEITKRHWDLLQEARTGIDWRTQEGRTRYREAQENFQKEYAAEVERILAAPQLEAYRALPEWSRSVQNTGRVSGPDESPGRAERVNTYMSGAGRTFRVGGGTRP